MHMPPGYSHVFIYQVCGNAASLIASNCA